MRAVITGGASGLGRAFALELARKGGTLVIADVDADGSEHTAEQVRAHGGTAFVRTCDVREPEQVEAIAAFCRSDLGGTDLLVNNAGVAVSGSFEGIPHEDWTWIVDINLWGVVHGCRAFLPMMRAQGRGQLINIASAAGLLSAPTMAPYNATKSAVIALSETLFAEYRPHGVNVTVVCPTFFQTNIVEQGRLQGGKDADLARKRMRSSSTQAPDVARAALQAVERGQLYCVPMRDGRMMWRLKRMAPHTFHRVLTRLATWRRR